MRILRVNAVTFWLVVIVFYMVADTTYYCIEVSLEAPRYVMLNGTASLQCHHNINDTEVYKIEWLRGGNKIYQYIKGRNPPFNNFSIVGADIDWSESNDKTVSLKNLQFEASGAYICEVTTDNPIYTKPSEEEYITVIQSQTENPHITFNRPNYTVGDTLDANCTSSPAIPVPELTWLLNGGKVDDRFVRSYPESTKASSMIQLRISLTDKHAPQSTLKCVSTIPGWKGHTAAHKEYADYREEAIIVSVAIPVTEAAQTAHATPIMVRNRWHAAQRMLFSFVLVAVCHKWSSSKWSWLRS